ncbi:MULTISPECIES: siderophore-interacting protein [Sinorhizobium]|uniref:siderophore-interacting protein n=1 Tax=Sinorhizobium TaxID=28105 RepID=UPI0024B09F25|nr:siderophore-interacting protein [Sinorhizobium terangae]WFU51943.1 siderophore-interacting protein [Sinorhizobium terangae]
MNKADVNPPYDIFSVTVKKATLITPLLKRISVDAQEVSGLRPDLPGQYLKVFVRDSDGFRQPGRAYTVRRFNPTTSELELDFVLHGDEGNISRWASRAEAGDRLEISRPNTRSGISINPEIRNYILFADETGLPAVAAIVEALPPTAEAQVFIEIANAEEMQSVGAAAAVSVRWLCRELGETLVDAVKDLSVPSGSLVWVTAESGQVSAIRTELKRQQSLETCAVHASGYWKKGVADHREPD